MKIRALRVSELGLFSEPVALEGLSGGVDVLCGPNEMGKSTLFRALVAAFGTDYTTTSQKELKAIRPRTGGDPLVEIDFEAHGGLWRVRKRFGSSKARMAEITDLTAGRVVARGSDAEDKLGELTGRKGPTEARFGLLWVGQDPAQLIRPPETDEKRALESAIEAQVRAVASGAEMARVRKRVRDLLDVQVTSRGAKANSPYARALARQREVAAELDQARRAEQRMTSALDEIERLRSREAELASPAAAGALANALAEAEKRLTNARHAQALHSEARAKASEAQRARDAVSAFDRLLSELAAIQAELTTDRSSLAALESEAANLRSAGETAAAVLEQLSAGERNQRELQIKRAAADAAADKTRQLAELSPLLEEARRVHSEIWELQQALRSNVVTQQLLARIDKEQQAITLIDARLSAAMPTLTIAYEPGRHGAIRLDGAPALEGATRITGSTVIEIAGIGTIRIEPGGGADVEADREDKRAHCEQLAALLVEAGARDIASAREKAAERQECERSLSDARTRFAALAPKGLPALEASVTDLQTALASAPAERDLPELRVIEKALAEIASAMPDARSKAKSAQSRLAEAQAHLAKASGEHAARQQRLAAIEKGLPPAPQRAEHRERLVSAAESRESDAGRVEMAARALLSAMPTEVDIAHLAAERGKAENTLNAQRQEMQTIGRRIAGLEGELEQMLQAGGGMRTRELEGDFELADAELKRIERDLAALGLLDQELEAVELEQREHYLRPVTERLTPYLAKLFPSAAAEIGQDLDVETIHRDGAAERLAELSGGTQEQIAVLVRLAFGRLLADAGLATPVILDDALVYSDDTRIEQVFRIIEEAGRFHQVIVLTCRSRTFAGLGGNSLKLQKWQRT